MPKIYVYGRDKVPTNWQETADILKNNQAKKPKPPKENRLDVIERLLREKGKG